MGRIRYDLCTTMVEEIRIKHVFLIKKNVQLIFVSAFLGICNIVLSLAAGDGLLLVCVVTTCEWPWVGIVMPPPSSPPPNNSFATASCSRITSRGDGCGKNRPNIVHINPIHILFDRSGNSAICVAENSITMIPITDWTRNLVLSGVVCNVCTILDSSRSITF